MKFLKLILLALIAFPLSAVLTLGPGEIAERAPASATPASQAIWSDLYQATRALEKAFDAPTWNVSNLEEQDSEGMTVPRTPHELKVLALRKQLDKLQSRIKKLGRKSENLSTQEIDGFLTRLREFIVTWHTDPLIRTYSSKIDDALRGLRDGALPVIRFYGPTRNLSTEEASFTALLPIRTRTLEFRTASQFCAMISAPGNIILRRAFLTDGTTDDDFGPATMKKIRLLEKLKGGSPTLRYRHSEVISQITSYNNIESISYYPWYFMINKPEDERKPMFMVMNNSQPDYFEYRSKYAVYRVKDKAFDRELGRRESALERLQWRKIYHRMGTCADFVNWAFSNAITSPWNQIPVIRKLVQKLYTPESIDTPDNLADSPDTERVCEIDNSNLLFPSEIDAKDWANRARADLMSEKEPVRKHAANVLEFLKKNEVLTPSGELSVEKISVQLRTFR